jgi:hexokinase
MNLSFNPEALVEFARYYGFHYAICDSIVLMRDAGGTNPRTALVRFNDQGN